MAIAKTTELVLDRSFDTATCRQQLNGRTHVLHCHHYISLYTQLAEDCSMCDARGILAESAEDAYHPILIEAFERQGASRIGERIRLAEQTFAVAGLGRLIFTAVGEGSGEVQLTASHIDDGWVKKWGEPKGPINHISRGFIAAAMAAFFNCPARSFAVSEAASIARGADRSCFTAVRI